MTSNTTKYHVVPDLPTPSARTARRWAGTYSPQTFRDEVAPFIAAHVAGEASSAARIDAIERLVLLAYLRAYVGLAVTLGAIRRTGPSGHRSKRVRPARRVSVEPVDPDVPPISLLLAQIRTKQARSWDPHVPLPDWKLARDLGVLFPHPDLILPSPAWGVRPSTRVDGLVETRSGVWWCGIPCTLPDGGELLPHERRPTPGQTFDVCAPSEVAA